MNRRLFVLLAGMVLLSVFLIACNRTVDTRQYVNYIGVVFTNEASDIVHELFVFPSSGDGTDVFEQDMGPDIIKNTRDQRRYGSFGVTLEVVNTSYHVMARDRDRGIYIFENVPLTNACEAVVTNDSGTPVLTIHHRDGNVDTMRGQIVREGDAPAHTQNPIRREIPIRFTLHNHTNESISFVTMREADNPERGEVYLFEGRLLSDDTAPVNIRLYEEDIVITEWIVYVEFEEGISMLSAETFNPWETDDLELSIINGDLVFE
ncbi:MAG: hypothetical protein FWE83_03325 [Oscillospiraceae bacterium]|nr:hypothetical protein [Oscillospiraceae bacterium]